MEVFTTATSAYLALQSLPLLLSPSLLVTLTSTEPHQPTNLETYLSRTLGMTLLTLAALLLLHSNTLPSSVLPSDDADSSSTTSNPYAQPTLAISTVYHALTAFYLYAQLTYMYTWNFAFTCGLLGSSALFCLGMWTLLFGGGSGSFSRRTGADKRTSGFPFANKESARAQRKESKEKEKGERKKRI